MTSASDSEQALLAPQANDHGAGGVSGLPSVLDIFLDPATMANPYPLYAELLARRPVQADDGLPVILTRYADVEAALAHPGLSTNDGHDAMMAAMASTDSLPPGLLDMLGRRSFYHQDPPAHTRLRRVARATLTPARTCRLRTAAARVARNLIGAARDRGGLDLIADFAYPLPLAVLSELLGIPLTDGPVFPWWRSQMAADFEAPPVAGEDGAGYRADPQEQMIAHFDELIARKRPALTDDVVSDLLAAQEQGDLSAAEVNDTCRLLAVAAHETATSLIANGMLALLRHPGQLRLLRAHPVLAGPAVDEAARYDAPIQFTRRVAATDVTVNGIPVERGRMVLAWIGAANRDPARFPEPGEFRLDRTDREHLGFGTGMHACLGAGLAHCLGEAAFAELSQGLPDAELVADPPAYLPGAIHAIAALPVTFGPDSKQHGQAGAMPV